MLQQPTFRNAAGEIVVNTRIVAAISIEKLRPNMLRRVHEFFISRGPLGATDQEIAEALGMKPDTARARRVELRDGGQVADSTRRRRNAAGNLCTIWTATGKPLS